MTGISDAAAERLRRRYPRPRMPRPLLISLIVAGALIAIGWLVWAGLDYSRPPVAGRVLAYRVTSDTAITVTLTVERRDPSRPARCRLVAQATDFQPVAEQQVLVEPSSARVVDTEVVLTTLRRATSVSVKGCELA